MRIFALASLIGAIALALAAGPTGSPAGPARSDAATDGCREPLNPDRRTVYRYTNGSDTLGFGQVVVTATKADGHRYCMRIGFGGRTVVHSFSQASYLRRNGKWVYEGGLGSGTYTTGAYTQTLSVRDKSRTDRGYAIRRNGRWYRTIVIRRFNL